MAITVDSNFTVSTYVMQTMRRASAQPVRALGFGSFVTVSFDGTKIYAINWKLDGDLNPVGSCDCEAGLPTHEGQTEKYCYHRNKTLPLYLEQVEEKMRKLRNRL